MKFRYLVLASLLVLPAYSCSSGNQQSTIAALEVGLASAETLATTYKNLPPCGSVPCSDPLIVTKMKVYDQQAYDAIKAAEKVAATGASVDLTVATTALTAFQDFVAANTSKGN